MNKIQGLFKKIVPFFKDVQMEVKKVNWPTRKETLKYTVIVIAVSAVTAAFLGGLDFIFSVLINKLIIR